MKDLAGKSIFITGATRGIGRAISLALAELGAEIVFNFREGREGAMESLRDELLQKGAPKASALMFDVAHTEQMKNAVGDFLRQGGGVQGLVNNAGISKDQLLLRLKEESVEETLAINLKGAIFLTQALARSFLKQESSSIVNISSVVGLMGNAGQLTYATSKAALIGMTKSLAKELASRNVRCNAVCPGFIETDMTQVLDAKAKETYWQQIPLKRPGQAAEVAQLVSFLLSDVSSYITGEVIKIDGGLYI